MLYIIAFSTALIFYFLIRHPKNIYSIIFSLDMLAISLLLIANIIYTLRINILSYSSYVEYVICRKLSRIPLSVFDTRILVNIAVFILVFTSTLLQNSDIKDHKYLKLEVSFTALWLCFAAFMQLYVNSPKMTEYFYLLKHSGNTNWIYIPYLLKSLNTSMLLSCVLPSIKYLKKIIFSRIIFKKRHLSMLLILHSTFYSVFLSILFFTPVKTLWNNIVLYNFDSVDRNSTHSLNTTIIVLLFLLLLMLFFNFNALNEKVFNVKISANKKSILAISDMRHVFHSYKNAMFSIKLLAEKSISGYGSEDALSALYDIKRNADTFLIKATKFLNIYNNINLNFCTVNIVDCVEAACVQIPQLSTIQLIKNYTHCPLNFYGDSSLITEVFVNLLTNSLESIERSSKADGKIIITIWAEAPWICVSIWDNGSGIAKALQKKIFTPLFSTKKTFNNWGIGLSHVKNIVLAHSGYVNIKSSKNVYSEFQVALLLESDK